MGGKKRASRDKKKYSNHCVVRKKISERNKKLYPPPFKLNGRSLSRQTGSRNLMGPKTIWGTYMKLVTKYQISAINSC